MPIRLAERRLQARQIRADRVEHALLAGDPALIAHAEEPIEEIVRNHFGRERAVGASPTQVAVDVFTVRFLADADLKGAEPRLAAHRARNHLIDRRAAGAAARVRRAGDERAHRFVMRVAGRRDARVRVVDAADDMDVVSNRRERREARCQLVVDADLSRNPIPLGNAVAVEPEHETRLHRGVHAGRRVRGSTRVEHGRERRQADPDCRAGHAHVSEEPSSAERHD